MNSFRQHIPRFVDVGKSEDIPFETTEDLLELEIVKRYNDKPGTKYVMSDELLMTVQDDGFCYWVVGSIKNPNEIKLPQWEGWKFRAILDNKEVILSNEVISSCGDVLTLRDGRTAKQIDRE